MGLQKWNPRASFQLLVMMPGTGRRPALSSERKGTRRERGEVRCFSYSKVPFAYGLTPGQYETIDY